MQNGKENKQQKVRELPSKDTRHKKCHAAHYIKQVFLYQNFNFPKI
jgi:hypothetical protein